ncbi:MAG: RNB domain-containing ribonuclease [Armatimonadetes bacterium]|nr:RNB domain-containing ribonuclease [Armatimonadota bacterium]
MTIRSILRGANQVQANGSVRAGRHHHGDRVELRGLERSEFKGVPWMSFHEGLKTAGARLEAMAAAGLGPSSEPVARAIQQILDDQSPSEDLKVLADRAMAGMGLASSFPPDVMREVEAVKAAPKPNDSRIRDLRADPWVSVDNGILNPKTLDLEKDSKDLDQLSVGKRLPNGNKLIRVAIANVAAVAPRDSATYRHAMLNTRTVYTDDKIYPMIPERFSTDLTSLNEGEDRLAVVKEYEVKPDGTLVNEDMYEAWVHNHAKMAYESVSDWLEDKPGPKPPQLDNPVLAEQIRIQDEAAQALKARRFEGGAVSLGSQETRADTDSSGQVVDLVAHKQRRAHELIENLMVAANGVTARYLDKKGYPSFRRVVKLPEKWDRLRALAKDYGNNLPRDASSKALNKFLQERRQADPLGFADLSLKVVKLIGRGEYMAHIPGEEPPGHFALAVLDYAHSTAPNRRGPDLSGQLIEIAAVRDEPAPFDADQMADLSEQFTQREEDVNKVERQVNRSAKAKMLKPYVGERFEAIVVQSGKDGTYVRIPAPEHEPRKNRRDTVTRIEAGDEDDAWIQGKLVSGGNGVKERQEIVVTLKSVDIAKGWIDFETGGGGGGGGKSHNGKKGHHRH